MPADGETPTCTTHPEPVGVGREGGKEEKGGRRRGRSPHPEPVGGVEREEEKGETVNQSNCTAGANRIGGRSSTLPWYS